jgi:SAM-dependent methyltransferase
MVAVRGWLGLYRTSVGLGLRYLVRHGYLREAVIRVVVPLEPIRYVELPDSMRELAARPGERVLDLASPKLSAVALARDGVEVVSVDELPSEVEAWRKLAEDEPNVTFEIADGRWLPFEDETFDHAYSISVIEHIARGGDEKALRELGRVVRPGGRVVVTVPYAERYRDEFRDRPVYVFHGRENGRVFFQRWYDDEALDRLVRAAPELSLTGTRVAGLRPNLSAAYTRLFPWLVPLGPFYGLLAREREGPGGDVARLTFLRR